MKRRKTKLSAGDILISGGVFLIAMMCVLPFLYVLTISFTDPDVYEPFKFYLLPPKWSLESYKYILSTHSYINSLKSTLFITVVGTALDLAVTLSMAYGLTKTELPGHKLIYGMVIVTLFFNAGTIPTYLVVQKLHLLNSYWALIWSSLTSAWHLIVVCSFIRSIPLSLEEAARIDGCSEVGVFFKIILPLSMPIIATFTLFFAVMHWNTYFDAMLYISDTEKWTLQLMVKQLVIDADASGVAQSFNDTAPPQETMRMASVVLSMLPIMCVYPFLQKHFAKGVMVGSVKG